MLASSGFSLTLSSYVSSNHSSRSGSSVSSKPSGASGSSNKDRKASAIRLLSAACSSLMGGGGGTRGLQRSRSASSRASIRRLYSRILWPRLPAGMRRSFCLLQQILKFVQALLQLVLLAYPTLQFDGPKLGVGYLARYRGCRSLRPALKHSGVEVLEPSLDLLYLRGGAARGRTPGSL